MPETPAVTQGAGAGVPDEFRQRESAQVAVLNSSSGSIPLIL